MLRETFPELSSNWLVNGSETEGAGDGAVSEGQGAVRWNRMLQYPRVLPGDHGPPAHQVVVRGHMSDDPPSISVADLHTDTMDGGGDIGTCTVFAQGDCMRDGQWTDFVVFPGPTGGCGARVRVMVPGWVCALVMPAGKQLHGGVLVDTASCAAVTPSPASPTTAPPVLEALHVVTYNLARTEDFIADMQTKSAEEQWECVRMLDTRLQGRV